MGDWHSELHEEAVASALDKLDHEVFRFPWHVYFSLTESTLTNLWRRFQNKYLWGGQINLLNQDLITMVRLTQPQVVFFYRGTHVFPETLSTIRSLLSDAVLVGYNNDDPFAQGHSPLIWRHFLKSVPLYDLMLAYRHQNIDEFLKVGAQRVELLRSWYYPERNHPVNLSDEDKAIYECDVVFIGHYENDGRKLYLEELVRQGYKVRLFGPGYEWDKVIKKSPELQSSIPVTLLWGEEYNKALCGAKIALCFLSKLNRDTYTRRCFEIPATKSMMLSEYTEDLAHLFAEGKEADFFRNKEELIQKVNLYLNDEKLRRSVANKGYQRVISDGHDVISRMKELLQWVAELNKSKGE